MTEAEIREATQILGSYHMTPFWKLRARLRERGLFDAEAAQLCGIAPTTFSRRMRGLQPWTSEEIATVCRMLSIPQAEVGLYFFPDLPDEK